MQSDSFARVERQRAVLAVWNEQRSRAKREPSAGLKIYLQLRKSINAQIAQSVEQRIENPRVGGSIPPLGTIIKVLVFKIKRLKH